MVLLLLSLLVIIMSSLKTPQVLELDPPTKLTFRGMYSVFIITQQTSLDQSGSETSLLVSTVVESVYNATLHT